MARRTLTTISILAVALAAPSAASAGLGSVPIAGHSHAIVGEGGSSARPTAPATTGVGLPKAAEMLVGTLMSSPESCTRGDGGSCSALFGL